MTIPPIRPAGPRWSLRKRLVLAVVGLLAIVAIVIGSISVLALQGFLVNRLDDQLNQANGRSQKGFGLLGQESGDSTSQVFSQERLNEIFNRQAPDTVVAVVSPAGNAAARKDERGDPQLLSTSQSAAFAAVPSTGKATTVSVGGSLGSYRAVAVEYGGGVRVITALPLGDVQTTLVQLGLIIAIVTAAGLVLAAFLALWIVRVALRPLERVVSTATRVAELPLDRGEVALGVRVPDDDSDPHTEVGKVGAALNRMLGHVASALTARQASENKVRQFLADASHELRTPLAAIRGYAELTRRGNHDLPADVVHSLGRVESEAIRMTSLVEDLLLLARLDEGRDLESAQLDLSRLLIDAVSDAHAAGAEHNWSLNLPDKPVMIDGDSARLHQVFANLLANARVHTPAGTDVMTAVSIDGANAVVTVTDDGPGIPADLQPVLFERFARGDSSRSRAAGSTGLGLAIVAAVIGGHGGTVEAQSEPGDTSFRVILPLTAGVDRGSKAKPRGSESVAR
ncbi:HAMP domain-containing sensor histidine kinase [Frigoribacterium sp. CG_9.8]|uniref:sensor histidine kinase n=1 Tax=Frigoribacterium sp. CG_9.8 TaxID=2787733 RepID=UPI001A185E0E|nr:HAMP domain-containing sensor histidine kinase [Frigoribacterium sp. CG_9.8]MBG6106488.1 two-component system OmpR family sensor kinase [Frigoribacterium sp. CG_9.8]